MIGDSKLALYMLIQYMCPKSFKMNEMWQIAPILDTFIFKCAEEFQKNLIQ